MMLKIQIYITVIKYNLKYIQLENSYFKIVIIFHNIAVLLCFDQIIADILRHVFQKHLKS